VSPARMSASTSSPLPEFRFAVVGSVRQRRVRQPLKHAIVAVGGPAPQYTCVIPEK
jgi:2-keto-3-deoxy-6-phosphogluconate aldolase